MSGAKPIDDAIIFHPLTREFVRVKGHNAGVVARMPITLDQFLIFERFDCYTCYDPVGDHLVSEDLA